MTWFGIRFERKQIPRIVENLRKSLNAKETREADRLGPRQVRYQAALRPDRTSIIARPSAHTTRNADGGQQQALEQHEQTVLGGLHHEYRLGPLAA
jgi:hypothetical protein